MELNSTLVNSTDERILQNFQDNFCRLIGVCAVCFNSEGRACTVPSGSSSDLTKFSQHITESDISRLYERVSSGNLEDEAIEDTDVPDIKYGAVVVRTQSGKCSLVWILQAAVSDPDTEGFAKEAVGGFSRYLSQESFIRSLDLLCGFAGYISAVQNSDGYTVKAAPYSESYGDPQDEECEKKDRKYQALTDMLQVLDSDEDIVTLMNKLLRYAAVTLDISSAQVYKIHNGDREQMDVIAQYCASGTVSLFDHTLNIKRLPFLYTDQVMTYNEGRRAEEETTRYCRDYGIKALIVLPINIRSISDSVIGMYICFEETRRIHTWSVDEIQLMRYAATVMQALVNLQIKNDSLKMTEEFQDSVLCFIGNAIYVRNLNDGSILFSNNMLQKDFAQEVRDGTLYDLFEKNIPADSTSGCIEVEYAKKHQWYELAYAKLAWISDTNKPALLCSIHDETEKKQYQKRIEQQAYTDFLTGLFNRMCCERDLAKYVDYARSNGVAGTLLYMDLDDFKHINDGLGHQNGDLLLRSIAKSIHGIEGINNTCYRMGGDEFVIIIPPEYYTEESRILDEIKSIFNKPWFIKDADYYCTMSMGVVHFPESGTDVQELIKKADIAMYESKKSGKNRITRYSGSEKTTSSRRLDMEKYMREAVEDDCRQFEVYYQPIIDMQLEGRPCSGAEALIRWNSPKLGFIGPADFIPLAEYLGLINPIGDYVLNEACKACHRWNENGHPGYKVNVNLSVVQLLQSDIVDKVMSALRETQLKPGNLTLEVTESLAINDMSRMHDILEKIRETGVRIALDDFGTGYSSLNHIREIPLDVIKVDQSFVRDLSSDSYSQSFIRMVSDLGNTIDKRICVEGIEMEDQFKILEDMNVRLVQGYYIDKPMPKDSFEKKYVDNGIVQDEENEMKSGGKKHENSVICPGTVKKRISRKRSDDWKKQ